MGGVAWEEKHLAFADFDVLEYTIVDDAEEHGAFILVEPFLGFVNMIIRPLVRSTYDHNDKVLAFVGAEVVHWWLEEVGVFVEPFGEVEWGEERHGKLTKSEQEEEEKVVVVVVKSDSERSEERRVGKECRN